MNERIRELLEQATRKYDRLGFEIPFAQPDLEMFTELIVRECIDAAFHKGHPDLEFLLKHFGVEE